MVVSEFDIEGFTKFIASQSDDTKVYIGSDSRRVKSKGRWFANYAIVVVVHIGGCKGCRIFGRIVKEPDYDMTGKKPALRLFQFAVHLVQLFDEIKELISRFNVEIHLDLNGKEKYRSNQVVSSAVGYIRGHCMTEPKIKPEAFAATYAADHLAQILHYKVYPTSVKPKFRTNARKAKDEGV